MSAGTYTLKSGDVDTIVATADRRTAFQRFFEQVLEDDYIDTIGQVVRLHDGEAKYPMRTVPALYAAGVIDYERAVANITEATGADSAEADRLLQDAVETDVWVVSGIDRNP